MPQVQVQPGALARTTFSSLARLHLLGEWVLRRRLVVIADLISAVLENESMWVTAQKYSIRYNLPVRAQLRGSAHVTGARPAAARGVRRVGGFAAAAQCVAYGHEACHQHDEAKGAHCDRQACTQTRC
jgi:hypothetical protein